LSGRFGKVGCRLSVDSRDLLTAGVGQLRTVKVAFGNDWSSASAAIPPCVVPVCNESVTCRLAMNRSERQLLDRANANFAPSSPAAGSLNRLKTGHSAFSVESSVHSLAGCNTQVQLKGRGVRSGNVRRFATHGEARMPERVCCG
jgi:hypothetical protein